MALAVDALTDHEKAELITLQVDDPTTRAKAVISIASEMDAPATYAGADLHSGSEIWDVGHLDD